MNEQKQVQLKENKICFSCKEEKKASEFYVRKYKHYVYLYSRCKICENKNSKYRYSAERDFKLKLKNKYKLSWDEYIKLFETQNKTCAICKTPILLSGQTLNKSEMACVDHDHKTGKVRGLLCDCCNKGLGQFKDNKDFLNSAISYLDASN